MACCIAINSVVFMKLSIKILLLLSLPLHLSGCLSLGGGEPYADDRSMDESVLPSLLLSKDEQISPYQTFSETHHDVVPAQHIGHYVRNMAQDLVNNMENINPKTPVAITHFAKLDSDLTQTNLLALQIAESFMHEFHQFRIPVIDFKTTDYIRVTQRGDFYLTRDHTELEPNLAIDYVITGTLVNHQGGYMVNARLISVENQQLVASAQAIIPSRVVKAILDEQAHLGLSAVAAQ